jgi:hypothetical protein
MEENSQIYFVYIDLLFHYVKYHNLTQNIVHFIERALYTQRNQDALIAILRKYIFHQSDINWKDFEYVEQRLIDVTSNGKRFSNGILSSFEQLLSYDEDSFRFYLWNYTNESIWFNSNFS